MLVAVSKDGELIGGIVCFGDMAEYGSGGGATTVKDASGIRRLGVLPKCRNAGVGKALTSTCILLAKEQGHFQVIPHTTQPMRIAWRMYEWLGFVRSEDLDFLQQGPPMFGLKLWRAPR